MNSSSERKGSELAAPYKTETSYGAERVAVRFARVPQTRVTLWGRAALGLVACACLAAAETNPAQLLATAPLRFEPYQSASDSASSRFVARGTRFHFEFSANQALLSSGGKSMRLAFEGASSRASIQGTDLLPSTTNLYLGSDPSAWRRDIPNYGRVQIAQLYPGIDLAYYGSGEQLEYDLTVKPGADPRQIRLRFDGAHLDRSGDLAGVFIQKHAVAYQIAANGSRRPVASSYRKNADGSYGFELDSYDRSKALVIDPVILAHYISGSHSDIAYGIGHDSKGRIYIAGTTQSTDLTLEGSSLQTTEGGGIDLFLAVINPALSASSQVTYVTYIGGSQDETFGAMAVGPNGDVYMTGSTASGNFPMANASQTTVAGSSGSADAFVLQMTPNQTLYYSTYFGGSALDKGTAIAASSNGWLWVAGNTQSGDLPSSTGFQTGLVGTQNMFLAVFDPTQSGTATKKYSIYIGGTNWDEAYGVAPAPDGTVWLAGGTFSSDIWMTSSAFQGKYGGDGDAYIAHINPNLGSKALLYATFLGGRGIDEATSMLLDPAGRLILSGYTLSTNFPVTSDAFQTKYGGDTDAFISILDPVKNQLVYSTYFGGEDPDAAMDLKEDSNGILYVSGYTQSPGLPATTNAIQTAYDGSVDAFGLKLDPTKSGAAGVEYFTYLGSDGLQVAYGIDFDSKGNMYLAGYSSANILSRIGGPQRTSPIGSIDAFVVGFDAAASTPVEPPSAASGRHRRLPWRVIPHR